MLLLERLRRIEAADLAEELEIVTVQHST